MNTAYLLTRLVERLKVKQGFSLVGGMSMFINEALDSSSEIEISYLHHEVACVCAADGYSRVGTEKQIGLAVITSGPAVTNAVSGIMAAYGDSSPVLIFAGQVKTSDINRGQSRGVGIQEVPSEKIVTPITKLFCSLRPEHLEEQLKSVVEALKFPRLGPVFVEIPLDVQTFNVPRAEEIVEELASFYWSGHQEPRSENLLGLSKIMASSARPVVMIGNGCRFTPRFRNFQDELDQKGVPRAYTWLSFDLEPADNQLNIGCPGILAPTSANRILQSSDLTIVLGARLDLATTAFAPHRFGNMTNRLIVDVDEHELAKFRNHPNTTCVQANVTDVLEELVEWVQGVPDISDWSSWAKEEKQRSYQEEEQRLSRGVLSEYHVARTLSDYCESVTIVLASSGVAEERITRFLRPRHGTRVFNGAALGSMGMGLSHGIGASLGQSPTRPTWILEADGGLWMQSYSLESLRHLKSDVTVFVLNNGGYGSIKRSQLRAFGREFGAGIKSGLGLPSYKKICNALEIPYFSLTSVTEFDAFAKAALNRQSDLSPRVVEIFLDENDDIGPALKTVIRNGQPTTPHLEEISW